MHIRRSPSGDGPTIYRPSESVASVRLDPPARPVAHEPDSIPPPPRDSLLMRVNRRRGQILTVMVSIAAIASFGSVVWWAHNQDVKAGGRGLEPLVVQAPATPSRVKPENAGGLTVPNQDKEVFNRLQPNTVPAQPEKLLPGSTNPKLPAGGILPTPAAPKPPDAEVAGKTPTPLQAATPAAATPGAPAPAVTETKPAATESGPSIASLIDNISGPVGGWRVQVASVKNEDVAKSTWARLQSAHGDVMANLRMQAVRVDLGDKGVWYRVQGGPLDEKQAQSVCATLKTRKADCVLVPPAR
jgi:cell division septation protein DedD